MRRPLDPRAAVALLDEYRHFPSVGTDYALILSGIEQSVRHRISYWDGTIVAAASALGAAVIYSEDLGHGQRYGSVRVFNPYLG